MCHVHAFTINISCIPFTCLCICYLSFIYNSFPYYQRFMYFIFIHSSLSWYHFPQWMLSTFPFHPFLLSLFSLFRVPTCHLYASTHSAFLFHAFHQIIYPHSYFPCIVFMLSLESFIRFHMFQHFIFMFTTISFSYFATFVLYAFTIIIVMLSPFHVFTVPTFTFHRYHFHIYGYFTFVHSHIHVLHFPLSALSFSCDSFSFIVFMHHSLSSLPLCTFVMIPFCCECTFRFVTMSAFHFHIYHFHDFLHFTISFSTIPPFH